MNDHNYRYRLMRDDIMTHTSRVMRVVCLNPSTATDAEDDATTRKLLGFAERYGCVRYHLYNLYAYRATKPKDLLLADDPIGPLNDGVLRLCFRQASRRPDDLLIFAWGANAQLQRAIDVLDMARKAGANPLCWGETKVGHPRHPLYLPYVTKLREFDGLTLRLHAMAIAGNSLRREVYA